MPNTENNDLGNEEIGQEEENNLSFKDKAKNTIANIISKVPVPKTIKNRLILAIVIALLSFVLLGASFVTGLFILGGTFAGMTVLEKFQANKDNANIAYGQGNAPGEQSQSHRKGQGKGKKTETPKDQLKDGEEEVKKVYNDLPEEEKKKLSDIHVESDGDQNKKVFAENQYDKQKGSKGRSQG